MLYAIGVIFFFCFLIKWIDGISRMTIAFGIPIAGFTVFYALIGRYISIIKSHLLNKKSIYMILLILEVIGIAIGSVYNYQESKNLLGYDSPIIALLSITVFCLFSGFTTTKVDFLWTIDRLCFGVYLIHLVFINFVYKFLRITPITFGKLYPVMTAVFFWLFFTIVSFVGSWIMYQMPILKKYIL